MDCAKMRQENPTAVPTPFRGLQVLLVDNDTTSLLDIASKLEDYSYRVTTTELPTVALSILEERADRFDLVMADINMPEMDCFKFIESVQRIKDFPIILMSAELKKDIVEEAMIKGACFFLKKPISSKNLKNVWQHVYRKSKYENSRGGKTDIKSKYENSRGGKTDIKSTDDQEAESQEAKVEDKEKVLEIINESTSHEPESEQVGDSDQIENDLDRQAESQEAKVEDKEKVLEIINERTSHEPESEQVGDSEQIENDLDSPVDGKRLTKLTGICKKRSMSPENDETGELKRKRTEDEGNERTRTVNSLSEQLVDSHKQVDRSLELDEHQAFTDSSHFPTAFVKLLQESDTINRPNFWEDSPFQSKVSTGMAGVNKNLDQVTELASSSCSLNQEQLHARVKTNEKEEGQVEVNVQLTQSDNDS